MEDVRTDQFHINPKKPLPKVSDPEALRKVSIISPPPPFSSICGQEMCQGTSHIVCQLIQCHQVNGSSFC